MTPKESRELLKDLKEIEELSQQLGYVIPTNWLSEPEQHARSIKGSLKAWRTELKEAKNDLAGLNLTFRNNLNEITSTNDGLNLAKKAMRGINSLSQDLADEQAKIVTLDKFHLLQLQEKFLKNESLLQAALKMEGLNENEEKSIHSQINQQKILNEYIKERLSFEEKINEEIGLAGVAVETLQKLMWRLGGSRLSDYLGIDDAMNKTRETARKLLEDQEQFGKYSGVAVNKFRSLKTLSINLGKNLFKAIGPAAILAGIVSSLIKALGQLDGQTGEIAQNLGLSYEHSIGITQEFNDIVGSSDSIWMTSKNINESFLTLSEALGTNTMLSKEMLTNFTLLTKQIGLSTEAATTLSKISLVNDTSTDQLSKTYLGQIKLLNIKNDLSLNEKAILNDINNISKGLLATFVRQPQELAKAVFESRKLGLELKTVEGLSSSLLDIESSIASEFEAEVLTGRALNLERARFFALTNDIAGVAKEINNQGISSVEFSRMYRIQQEAIAKAVGMSRDEMSNMLIEQEAIRKVGANNLDDLKEKLSIAQAQGREEEFMAQIGNEQYANLLKSQSAQARFGQTMEKLKDVFVQLVDPLLPVLDIFANIMGFVGVITKLLDPILKAAGTLVGFVGDIFSMIGGDFDFSEVQKGWDRTNRSTTENWGWDTMNYIKDENGQTVKRINDGVIEPDGTVSVSTPKGSVKLDDQDTFIGNKNGIIAGTDLGGNSGNITIMSNALGNKLDVLINEMRNMTKEVKKGMTVNLDGNKVSNELLYPLSMNIRNT